MDVKIRHKLIEIEDRVSDRFVWDRSFRLLLGPLGLN